MKGVGSQVSVPNSVQVDRLRRWLFGVERSVRRWVAFLILV